MEPFCCLGLFSSGYLAALALLHRLCNVQCEDECVLEFRRMGKEEGYSLF
jgi:hypothetical protein